MISVTSFRKKLKMYLYYLCGARCGEPGGEGEGDIAGVAGAEAARRREYSEPPTASAEPPPSRTRVTARPDEDRVGRELTVMGIVQIRHSNTKL